MADQQQDYQLRLAARHHIDSFNYIYEKGLQRIMERFVPMEINEKDFSLDPNAKKQMIPPFKSLKISFENLSIGKPYRKNDHSLVPEVYPVECRLAGKTYAAELRCELLREIDGNMDTLTAELGEVPIMVNSSNCHLAGMTQQELIQVNQDPNQFGGYFIVNGNEKMIRMLIVQKKNYPIAFLRPSFSNRGSGYTQFAVQMRCVRDDFYSKTITLHYIADGNVNLRIMHRKQEFLIPVIVIMKAIGNFTDQEIYQKMMNADYKNIRKSDRIQVLIKVARSLGLYTQDQFLEYLGKNFRMILGVSANYTDREAGHIFLGENICCHIDDPKTKLNTLCLMIDKLYSLVDGDTTPENLDSLSVQEILLPGHLYLATLREKLEETLSYLKTKIMKDSTSTASSSKITTIAYIKKTIESGQIGKSLEFFLATGNLKSKTGLDLMQDKGFAVIADRLNNMRFLSHFRSIHRGAYFAEMKTTAVRKLMPESWGFLCPVHTPDGAPCGLLNHITISCCPLATDPFNPEKHVEVEELCSEMGMLPLEGYSYVSGDVYPVIVEGGHVGYIDIDNSQKFVSSLRMAKIAGKRIPKQTQIAFYQKKQYKNTIYPMVFITTSPARFLRPVHHLRLNTTEWISPAEQLVMDIGTQRSEYSQISRTNILSILPQHIPFLNFNQSPRNMYQCQMAKQTMGTSVLNWPYRYDNKLYRILHSQLPIVRTKFYDNYKFADYNSGTNAVVAVLSYTGYDMEDAMIINKSSYENGFGHGVVYKTVEYVLSKDDAHKKTIKFKLFKQAPLESQKFFELPEGIESDGLCKVGARLKKFSPILVLYQVSKDSFKTFHNKESEPCFVEGIVMTAGEGKGAEKILMKLRFDRRPVIGDKFSSRHGQKGVLSMLWPKVDMPFSESGMTPDIIINPHAFPSRMTIGMLIESMAAKSAALDGQSVTYESFEAYENDDAINYFGKKLHQHGFNYHGNETMYSGVYGTQLKVDIFMGLVYYQRLRHMVHDKSQARSTGPVDILTQQPLKGRKKGGGIRMGEMERDAMLAHGVSQIVNERLYKSSDKSEGYVCNKCGLMLSCFKKLEKISGESVKEVFKESTICTACGGADCSLVGIPYVLKYLVNELAAMNIKLKFRLKN